MPRFIVLDTFPLSSTAKPPPRPGELPSALNQCHDWVKHCIRAGNRIVAPSVCYFETLRELERLNATAQISRLKQFCFTVPNRYISIADAHLELAAKFWAQARKAGSPTADEQSLDVDMTLAAQAVMLGIPTNNLIIATTNVSHLTQFVPADFWSNITP
jgi:hypothetical protein